MNLDEHTQLLVNYLYGKTKEEIAEILSSHAREAEKLTQQRRISKVEYIELLKEKLSEDNLRLFLEVTRCKHLYMLLYPHAKSTMDPEKAKWLILSEEDELEGSSGTSSDEDSNVGWYMDDLLRILKHINHSDRNITRLKFFSFLDLCWEAVGFDLWGKGTHDIVFEFQPKLGRNQDLKPSTLRGLFLVHIRNYLIKQKTSAEIGKEKIQILGDLFKGTTIKFI